jgi:asparagine synthase (glutamine-hydrolysing)
MTAIHGLWCFGGAAVDQDFRRMDSALSRYGSDDCQSWSADPGITIGKRLHRSLPEDRFGHQVAIGDHYVVVGDVRLTERDDLARQLELGASAAEMSDSAIAAAAVERWHEAAFDRIYGAFAIAAWDRQERRLLLARDHLGHKPLFFHRGEGFFAFASMPVGLHALPDIPRGPDMESMTRFLAVEDPAPGRTHFQDIGRVMPGHYATVTDRAFTQTLYWKPDLTPLRLPTNADYVNALAEHLDRAVAAALRGAGAEVGAHLSSGFDSTAVATTAARQLAASGGTLVAYTAAPREPCEAPIPKRLADESAIAAVTAAMHPNIRHVVIRADRSPLANLRRTASIYGLPILNICNTTWFDAITDDAAARGITVMLEGVAGNATISETGMLALPELTRSGRVMSWFRLARAVVRNSSFRWRTVLWESFYRWLPDVLYDWLQARRLGVVDRSVYSALKAESAPAQAIGAATESARRRARLLPGGWTCEIPTGLTDRLALLSPDSSGAGCKGVLGEWKIDYRDPTADRRLVEFSLRVPAEQLIHDGKPRAILRKVLADRVPREVLENAVKGYQTADWHSLLRFEREQVRDEVRRIESFGPSAEIIDVERLKQLVDNWPEPESEIWGEYSTAIDYRVCLLRAISAGSFMRESARSNH